MKRLRWQLLIVVVALIAIGVLLVGQQPVTVQPLQPEPVAGGTYAEALIGSLSRLNPLLAYYNAPDRDVNRLLYSSLIRFDDRGLPLPDLGESWGISADGTVYNFSLRQDAFWHDGNPVTARDVVFTLSLLQDPALPIPDDLRAFWEAVEVQMLDVYTLQFRLPEPFAPFLDYLDFEILPAHLLEGMSVDEMINAPFNLQPVGSGPFRFGELIVENGQIAGVTLLANEAYYAGRPYLDQITFRYYPDATAALTAYQAGDVQGIARVDDTILADALAEPNLNLYTSRLPQLTLVFLNLNDPQLPFFQDASIRRALLMGLNRQWMVDRLLKGQAILADGPIFPGLWAYYEGTPRVAFDPQNAVETIRAAGYTIPAEGGDVRANADGVFFAFTLLYPEGEPYEQLAQVIQENWRTLGVDVTLRALPYDELINDHLEKRDYQAALVDLTLFRSPDPDPYPFWHQTQITGGQNYAQWDDRQASEYLEQARITVDPQERTRLYRNFQVRFANELPALPLFYPVYTYGVDAAIKGVRIGPIFDTPDRFHTVLMWHVFSERGSGLEQPSPTP
ncbi:MAG: peptide ABC transporter substrate-binding protein [Anaerolineae bacterium]|nr:MAG: peptide ABC transporter substrate-binding protein [Anaerolineae bacterium]